jgi:hypothetical protein
MNSLSKLGRCSTGAADMAAFRAEKAPVAASVQWNPSFLRSSVRGAAMEPKSLMKRR